MKQQSAITQRKFAPSVRPRPVRIVLESSNNKFLLEISYPIDKSDAEIREEMEKYCERNLLKDGLCTIERTGCKPRSICISSSNIESIHHWRGCRNL